MDQHQSTQLQRCFICSWVGGDVSEIVTEDGPRLVCQSCLAAAVMGEQLGKVHPATLVPLIRSCVAQTVGVIMGQFLEYLSQLSVAYTENGMSTTERIAVIQSALDKLKKSLN